MYIKNLRNQEFVCMATTTTDHDLNGDKILTADLEYNKPNSLFLSDLEQLWTLVDDDEAEWKILAVQKRGEGKYLKAQIRAIPKFFDDFNVSIVHELHSGSMTARRGLDLIFGNSGYNYVLNGDYYASEWENFGGGSKRLKMFQDWLNRYGGEFNPPQGNTVFISNRVGEDLNVQYRHRLNASNIVLDVDASEMYTHIRGYADYEGDKEAGDWQDAKLISEYTSPLARILGIRESEPVKDGRIRHKSVLDAKMKQIVDESIKISVTADIHDLRKQGYPIGQTNVGDRVFLIDERIGFNEEVRVVNKKETKNWKGEIIDIKLTFGSQDIVKRHRSKMRNAANAIHDVLEGKRKIPMNALNNEVAQVTKALLSAQTELIFENGIIARDPNNPNLVVVLNSEGLGISRDGGSTFKNAITGRGILAENILAGTVKGLIVEGGEVVGGKISTTGGSSHIEIQNGVLKTFLNGVQTSSLDGQAHHFYRDDRHVGSIGTIPWHDDPSYRGLSFMLAHESDFLQWGYRETPDSSTYNSILSWHNNDDKGNKGLNFYDTTTVRSNDFRVGSKLQMTSSSNASRIGPDVGSGGTYIYISDNGQVGFVHNGVVYQSFNP